MKKTIQIVGGISIVMALLFSVMSYYSAPKIGVIDFKRIVNEYQGMKNATLEYEEKMKGWNSTGDSLSNLVKIELIDYYADSALLSDEELKKREAKIINMRNKYFEFTKGLEANAQQEDEKMTLEVVNQVLSFVEKYGNENGYDVILGKNEGNDVMYKRASLDITDEVLNALNMNYEGK